MRDAWIVGAGLAGATCAHEFQRNGFRVTMFEETWEWGGLTRTKVLNGIVYEPNGSHIVHTDDDEVWSLLTSLGPFRHYEHSVLSAIRGRMMTWPIQAEEVESLYGRPATELVSSREPVAVPAENFEEFCLSIMAPEVYDDFVKPYTEKQWGRPATALAATMAPKRVQVRTDGDKRLFKDRHQGFPDASEGHTYERQLEVLIGDAQVKTHNRMTIGRIIEMLVDTPRSWRPQFLVVTVPLDDFCNVTPLEWRGLTFSHRHVPNVDYVQPGMVVNYPGKEFPFIRTHETKHASGQNAKGSVVVTEFPGGRAKMYPVPGKDGAARRRNEDLALMTTENLVSLGPLTGITGRLAMFRYWDQDQVVRHALDVTRALLGAGDPLDVEEPA